MRRQNWLRSWPGPNRHCPPASQLHCLTAHPTPEQAAKDAVATAQAEADKRLAQELQLAAEMKAQAEQSFKDLGDKLRQENECLQETLQAEVKAQEKAREDAHRAREHAEAALQAQIAQVEVEKASATANQSEEEKALARAWEETEALKLQVLTQKTRLKLLEDELRVAQLALGSARTS